MPSLDLPEPEGTRNESERILPIFSKTNSGASMDENFKSDSFYDEMLFYSGKSKTMFDIYIHELRKACNIKPANRTKKLISEL